VSKLLQDSHDAWVNEARKLREENGSLTREIEIIESEYRSTVTKCNKATQLAHQYQKENAALKQEIEQLHLRVAENVGTNLRLYKENEQLQSDNAALMECLKRYERNLINVGVLKSEQQL
jgi:phage host-nuclease inhibitor protein Gam